jgi:hypothetical protein
MSSHRATGKGKKRRGGSRKKRREERARALPLEFGRVDRAVLHVPGREGGRKRVRREDIPGRPSLPPSLSPSLPPSLPPYHRECTSPSFGPGKALASWIRGEGGKEGGEGREGGVL